MTYCVTLKHGDVERHESMHEALLDLMECMDNPPGHGAEIWWEDPMDIEQVRACATADEARDAAIEWQDWFSTRSTSWDELAQWTQVFEELARRFPELEEEYRENGII